ncbi:hypothetical protein QUA56_14920 [Microcoleus sp. N3A4]|uniref:hypothetical protein n=1 Tax=Microcoleus sp. N3A4 TaxID=3055379 RepID=UPI002FD16D6F
MIVLPSLLNCYNDNQPKNLNAESMSTYSTVLTQVLRLAPDEQLRLISELLVYVRHRVQAQPKRSILELEGLGEEMWNRIDAQEYVNQERDSWNG